MNSNPQSIAIADFDYPLPDDRIAKFPLERRDQSKLLVYRGGNIEESRFDHVPELLPPDTLLIFNNTITTTIASEPAQQTAILFTVPITTGRSRQ